MKSFIVFAVLIAVAVAAPQHGNDAAAQTLRQESSNIGVGDYQAGLVFIIVEQWKSLNQQIVIVFTCANWNMPTDMD